MQGKARTIMLADPRRLAVALAGLCAFLDLYATQALLPLLAQEFRATPEAVSLTVSVTTFAVALVAPFVGIVADMLGRKRIIVGAALLLVLPTILLAAAASLDQLVLGRFVQGLLLPPIFAVTVAYIGDEWPPAEVPAVTGLYIAGSGLGGFLGRFVSGLASELWSWRAAFILLALITLACAIVIGLFLPRERRFIRAAGLRSSLGAAARHLRDRRILATFVIGFAVLFCLVASFTYVNFYLAAPPFSLSTAALGSIFVVYLLGVAVSPWTGRAVGRFGRRRLVLGAMGLWSLGLVITVVPDLSLVVVGLALAAACGFLTQACATSYLTSVATEGRSSTVGLYVTCYYIGGSVGALAPAPAWHLAGWPGCVALTILMLLFAAFLVWHFWREPSAPQQDGTKTGGALDGPGPDGFCHLRRRLLLGRHGTCQGRADDRTAHGVRPAAGPHYAVPAGPERLPAPPLK